MTAVYDVAIAGLGAMGSAAAWQLALRGQRVVGFDRFRPPHAMGSSTGKSRIIREAYFENPGYVPLVRRAYELWADLEHSSGRELLQTTGGLVIGPEDGTLVGGALASARLHGVPHELLAAKEISARYPPFHPDPTLAGLLELRAGVLMPEDCIGAMLEQAGRAGAELRFDEPVLAWEPEGDGVRVTTGAGPQALCYNPQNSRVYSANYDSDNVTVIDGVTDSVVATVAAGNFPAALCYNPTNNKVYCANTGYASVTVIDGTTDSVIATVAVGDHPYVLCYNPTNNKVYCANDVSDSVAVIDGATDSVVAALPVGSRPRVLCHNSSNNKVYCANWLGNDVTVIDGATNSVAATIRVGAMPTALAWNPVQNRVYVANNRGASISVLRDSIPPGMEESSMPRTAGSRPLPSIIRGVLFLPGAASHKPQAASLLDISGRKVTDLLAGANDVRALAPGVYFVREAQAQAQAQAIRKIVITR